jgi:hypothetical protein
VIPCSDDPRGIRILKKPTDNYFFLMILQVLTVLRLFPKKGGSISKCPFKADWISCQEGTVLCRF